MADKGYDPGVHIDPADFYKDIKQGQKAEGEVNKDKQENKNLSKEAESHLEKSKNNVAKNVNLSANENKNVQ